MYISILGRQPQLGIAELERLYGDVSWFSNESALINTPLVDLARLGGSQKVGRIVTTISSTSWNEISRQLVNIYAKKWAAHPDKITLGISAYGFRSSPRDIQKAGIVLKQKLKSAPGSLRLIPNADAALNTATSHHNKLGLSDNKVELLVVRGKNSTMIAESVGAQNITAYAKRDQGRPKRDAFVGMLPPKLAQIMLNLAGPLPDHTTLLDPFCGTGVVLQEAALMGYDLYGSDLSDKMIDYTTINLEWLEHTHHVNPHTRFEQGDATRHNWQQPISAVVCETYLGQPFSAPPSPAKLREVRGNCDHIISDFLRNIGTQITPGTPLCIAVPAWRDTNGAFTHLPLVESLGSLGYRHISLKTAADKDLLYYREDQVVARELLILEKA